MKFLRIIAETVRRNIISAKDIGGANIQGHIGGINGYSWFQ